MARAGTVITPNMPDRWGQKAKDRLKERELLSREWKAFRTSNLLFQKDLARLLGISKDTVYLVEKAAVTPSYKTRQKFNALNAAYEKEGKTTWQK